MYRTLLLFTLLVFLALPAKGRGLDLSDPAQAEVCAWLAALTQTVAAQAAADGIPAQDTEAYRTIKSDPTIDEVADVVARVVNQLDGRLAPRVVRAWSLYGYCLGLHDEVLFGAAATKVGAACNAVPDGTEHQCIERLLQNALESLPSNDREMLLEAVRRRRS